TPTAGPPTKRPRRPPPMPLGRRRFLRGGVAAPAWLRLAGGTGGPSPEPGAARGDAGRRGWFHAVWPVGCPRLLRVPDSTAPSPWVLVPSPSGTGRASLPAGGSCRGCVGRTPPAPPRSPSRWTSTATPSRV